MGKRFIVEKAEDNLSNIINKIIEKTIKDNNADWTKGSISGEIKSKNIKAKKAIQCFRRKGYCDISQYNTTFATKNTNNNLFWLNSDKRHLREDWYIILNDCNNKRLYLLCATK